MKPIRTFIFFTAVLLLISILAYLIPEQGIKISQGHRLTFLTFNELFQHDTVEGAENVKRLLAESNVTDDPESSPEQDIYGATNSLVSVEPYVEPANADSLQQSVFRILISEDNPDLLDPFFRKLEMLQSGEIRTTRIFHFGDSQIENDRMTALIRYRLQRHFGGTGSGMVQAIPLYSGSLAYEQHQEGEWLRYTYFGKRDTTIQHNCYGVMGAFASIPAPENGVWPMLHYRFNTSRRSGRCDRIRIFLHSYVEDASVAFVVNDSVSDTLKHISDGFNVVDFRHHALVNDVKLYFEMPQGGRIYGISFESYTGLQVDNIAMRGGSGLIFSKMNREQQQAMIDQLSPGLIMLQFGGNVVPYMDPDYYLNAFKRELQFYKEISPGVPVIVIGPSDMSTREKGIFNTYPGLESIRDALKIAALESGFAFWDLFEAMGGHNSMPSFVHSDPPLASTDYVHFTQLGINLVAEMFYNALMTEYNKYRIQKGKR